MNRKSKTLATLLLLSLLGGCDLFEDASKKPFSLVCKGTETTSIMISGLKDVSGNQKPITVIYHFNYKTVEVRTGKILPDGKEVKAKYTGWVVKEGENKIITPEPFLEDSPTIIFNSSKSVVVTDKEITFAENYVSKPNAGKGGYEQEIKTQINRISGDWVKVDDLVNGDVKNNPTHSRVWKSTGTCELATKKF